MTYFLLLLLVSLYLDTSNPLTGCEYIIFLRRWKEKLQLICIAFFYSYCINSGVTGASTLFQLIPGKCNAFL